MSTLVHTLAALRGSDLPGPVAVADDGSVREYTLGALVAAVEAFAGRSLEAGLRRGDRVAVAAPDPEYMLIATLGVLRAGGVPIALADPSLLAPAAWTAAAEAIVRMSAARWLVRPAGPALAVAGARPLVVDLGAGDVPGDISLPDPDDFGAGELALLTYTAGSAGAPRGLPLTHAALVAAAEAALPAGLGLGAGDRVLDWLPLHLDVVGAIVAPLHRRVASVLVRHSPLDPRRWLRTVDHLRATVTAVASATLAQPLRCDAALDLSRVRAILCNGDPLAPAALRAFADTHAAVGLDARAIAPRFLPIASAAPGEPLHVDRVAAEPYRRDGFAAPMGHAPEDLSLRALEFVSCGRPLPGYGVEIVDAEGEALGEREVGEIVALGPCAGEGGLRTGRRGYLADGRLYVTGRVRDVITVHGCSYDPQHIEREAARVPGIPAGGVVALARPGAVTDELVVVAEGRAAEPAVLNTMAAALRRQIQGALGLRVAALVHVPSGALPRSTRGDLQRTRARALYLAGAWS